MLAFCVYVRIVLWKEINCYQLYQTGIIHTSCKNSCSSWLGTTDVNLHLFIRCHLLFVLFSFPNNNHYFLFYLNQKCESFDSYGLTAPKQCFIVEKENIVSWSVWEWKGQSVVDSEVIKGFMHLRSVHVLNGWQGISVWFDPLFLNKNSLISRTFLNEAFLKLFSLLP